MWVNQWLHTAEKLNLKPKPDESSCTWKAPPALLTAQVGSTDPLWDDAWE